MRTVFFDVDTQLDFLYPAGALYVPGAEAVVENVAKLNRFAGAQGMKVVSTTDAHTENDPEFATWPPHCIAGTAGQHKPASTLLEGRLIVPWERAGVDIGDAQQVILEKRVLDCFGNPNLPALLAALGAERYVVYGVVTEICVRHAAMGLLQTGRPVLLAKDAARSLTDTDRDAFLAAFQAAGGKLATTAEITGPLLLH
jgi:nicotinamidase/pyrazinamidase